MVLHEVWLEAQDEVQVRTRGERLKAPRGSEGFAKMVVEAAWTDPLDFSSQRNSGGMERTTNIMCDVSREQSSEHFVGCP